MWPAPSAALPAGTCKLCCSGGSWSEDRSLAGGVESTTLAMVCTCKGVAPTSSFIGSGQSHSLSTQPAAAQTGTASSPGPGTPTARGKRRPPQPPALTPPLQFLLLQPAYWEPAVMEAGSIKEEVGATPQEGFSMGSMAKALQQASEETPDFAGPPENPASPSSSEPQAETVESPTSPAVVEVCTETMAKVVDSTPPASERSSDQLPPEQQSLPVPAGSAADDAGHTAEGGSTTAAPPARETHAAGEPKPPQAAEGSASEAAKGAPHCGPSGQALGSLEVECREALRTQWLSFPFDPEATAASTLAHCRAAASMTYLNTLAVWPDGSELDLSLTLEVSLRPTERRLLASGPADASVAAQEDRAEPSFEGKPITTPDGLTCL
eukprot:s9330_g1.t1